MKSLYLTRIYPIHKIFTQAAPVALMTFSMSDNIEWERLVREEARVREFVRFIDDC